MQLLGKYIFSPRLDILAFCSFIPLYIIYFFIKTLGIELPTEVPFAFFILGWTLVDGSHVYSTIYVTYMDREVRQRLKWHLILIPLIIFVTAFGLTYSGNRALFLSILAYSAAIHFIRQEFGWMKIATRLDKNAPNWLSLYDKFTSYAMTVIPLLWFIRETSKGSWYEEGDLLLVPDSIATFGLNLYWPIVILFLVFNIRHSLLTKTFNTTKFLVALNTFFGWYIAKTVVEYPYLAIWLMIFHHGWPYYLIVFKTEKVSHKIGVLKNLGKFKYPVMYLACAALFYVFLKSHCCSGFSRELRAGSGAIFLAAIYAFSITPQFTHFILDGVIWKRKVGIVHK